MSDFPDLETVQDMKTEARSSWEDGWNLAAKYDREDGYQKRTADSIEELNCYLRSISMSLLIIINDKGGQ